MGSLYIRLLTILLVLIAVLPYSHEFRHRRQVDESSDEKILSDKYAQLLILSSDGHPVIETNPMKFQKFIVETPRNYTTILLLSDTAPHCAECRASRLSLRSVAHAYQLSIRASPELFFAEVLASQSPEVLPRLGVPNHQLPVLFAVPPKGALTNLKEMNHKTYGFYTKGMATWIQDTLGVPISLADVPTKTEVKQSSFVQKVWEALWPYTFPVFCIYNKRESIKESFQARNIAGSIANTIIGVILVFISGYMYCSIESAPLIARNHEGGWMFISTSFGDQLLIEMVIMIVLYGIFIFGFIQLIELPRKPEWKTRKTNPEKIQFVGIGLLACCVIPVVLILKFMNSKLN